MKLTAPSKDSVTLDPIRPSAAVAAWYYSYVSKLVDEMGKDIEKEIKDSYPQTDTQLAKLISRLGQRWESTFAEKADAISKGFVARGVRNYDSGFNNALQKVGIQSKGLSEQQITLAMDADYPQLRPIGFQITSRIKKTIDSRVVENVNLIKSIPEQHLSAVALHVKESVEKGRDLQGLSKVLREDFDVTNRRAGFIARDQNNKVTAAINQSRQMDLGIVEAMWVHTGASLHPREDHAAFNGETYSVDEGVDFDDGLGPVLPGEAYNCGCTSRSIIPGFFD